MSEAALSVLTEALVVTTTQVLRLALTETLVVVPPVRVALTDVLVLSRQP